MPDFFGGFTPGGFMGGLAGMLSQLAGAYSGMPQARQGPGGDPASVARSLWDRSYQFGQLPQNTPPQFPRQPLPDINFPPYPSYGQHMGMLQQIQDMVRGQRQPPPPLMPHPSFFGSFPGFNPYGGMFGSGGGFGAMPYGGMGGGGGFGAMPYGPPPGMYSPPIGGPGSSPFGSLGGAMGAGGDFGAMPYGMPGGSQQGLPIGPGDFGTPLEGGAGGNRPRPFPDEAPDGGTNMPDKFGGGAGAGGNFGQPGGGPGGGATGAGGDFGTPGGRPGGGGGGFWQDGMWIAPPGGRPGGGMPGMAPPEAAGAPPENRRGTEPGQAPEKPQAAKAPPEKGPEPGAQYEPPGVTNEPTAEEEDQPKPAPRLKEPPRLQPGVTPEEYSKYTKDYLNWENGRQDSTLPAPEERAGGRPAHGYMNQPAAPVPKPAAVPLPPKPVGQGTAPVPPKPVAPAPAPPTAGPATPPWGGIMGGAQTGFRGADQGGPFAQPMFKQMFRQQMRQRMGGGGGLGGMLPTPGLS